jgi:hypothetical protein
LFGRGGAHAVTQGSACQWRCMGAGERGRDADQGDGSSGDNPSRAWVFSVTESQRLRAAGLCLECEDYRYDLSHRWLSRAFLAAERPVGGVTDPQRGLRLARDSAAYSAAESQRAVHLGRRDLPASPRLCWISVAGTTEFQPSGRGIRGNEMSRAVLRLLAGATAATLHGVMHLRKTISMVLRRRCP